VHRLGGVMLLAGVSLAWGQDPSARPAFEVAAIEPSTPLAGGEMAMKKLRAETSLLDMMPPGRIPQDKALVTIRGFPLSRIIAIAYRLPASQVVGPAWMADARFNIEAKIPDGAGAQANEMLQSLLEDRFALKFHRETRELPGYALAVRKSGPKLTESSGSPAAQTADPETDLKKKADMMQGGGKKTGGSWRSFQNASMDTIARALSQLLQGPVVNLTGLTGKYDLSWEIPPPEMPGEDPQYAIAKAVEKFGLKLERRKVPLEILVVDSISRTPTPN